MAFNLTYNIPHTQTHKLRPTSLGLNAEAAHGKPCFRYWLTYTSLRTLPTRNPGIDGLGLLAKMH